MDNKTDGSEEKLLCESDHRFMSLIWDNEPISSAELAKLCLEEFGWKKSTSYTMLKRLCDKGLAKNENSVVSSLVPRSEISERESNIFVKRSFGGSLPGFLVSFLKSKKLSKAEAEELMNLIEDHVE
ncbi:MAG: BlaI/MecI/CopY family transcriptional regulator [Clostridia bacterium]|nr:BlaI/MecI/CopY family transcriptional regulator [Clostridia bacterium]MBQ3849278.1 BlaI/MecI/CopY family transcriptional regulator [Clostridia bacterium]MBR3459894.1 BlaI/MecI/CopY family transcriptional regulator [Clostridia bacterium]MBR5713578.1 BlaI/MecI/CopY family transcriptional regulator [Clostridia bacterium]MBR5718295.1 BlaI/MecI/CopY family transcriptional regulator [Clostridia bacterium]